MEGGEAMGGAALGGDRGGFGSQARVVQELPERHDGKAAGSQGAEEPLENPGAQGECRQMVHESEGDGEVVRVAGETVGEGARRGGIPRCRGRGDLRWSFRGDLRPALKHPPLSFWKQQRSCEGCAGRRQIERRFREMPDRGSCRGR